MEEARCGSARLKVEDAAAGAAAPQGLSDYRPRGLSTQEGCSLAVKLEQSAEVISAPSQGIGQIAEDGAVAGSVPAAAPQVDDGLTDFNPWGLSIEEDEEKGCSLAVRLEQSAEVPFQVTGQIGEDGAVAVTVPAAAPQAGDGLSDYKPWGLSTEEGCSLAVKLEEQSVEVPFQVTGQIGEDKGSRMDDRPMNMDDDKFLAESGEAAESGSLKMRPVANAGLSSKALDVTCGGVVDKDTERSHYERKAGLAGNRGDWAGMPEVMTSKCGLKMVSEVPHCADNEGLSDSAKHATERWPRGVDGVVFMADGNYDLQHDDSMPKTETKVSVPSVSGRIDDSSNGKADRVGEISGDPVTDDRGDGLQPKNEAEFYSPAHEDSVPSTFGSNLAVSLDGKTGEIGEVSEHKSGMEKVACCSLGGGMESCDSGFLKQESLGDDIQFSRMDGCHENRGLGHQDSSGVKLGCPNHLALELNGYKSVIDKPCSAVFVENGNDEELGIQKSESLSVSRRRNPRRSASARNPTLEKHDQISKGGNSTCKSKKVESSCSLVESIMINFPNKTTKVRTGINRPLKSTAWGSLQKLTCGFGQNCEPSTSNSHLISLENGRSRKRSGKKEQPSTQKTRSSRCSKKKFPPFSANGFAPDELNGQPTVSVTACTYASSEGYTGKFPRLDHHGLVNSSDDTHKNAECMSIQTGLQQLGRCLESVTQETCSAYICGDFAKSTSEPSLNIAGVGFSPDSVLEVASATCENDTFANHDAKLRGNPSHPAAFTENGFHASALSTSDSVKNHASASADLEQWAHTVRSGENTRNEDSNPSRALLGYIGEGKVQVVEKSNAAKKSKKVGKQERQKKDGMKGKNIKDRGSTKIPSERRAFSDDSCSLVPPVTPKFGSCFEVVTSATRSVTMHEHDSMQGPSVIRKEKTSALDNVKSPRRRKNGGSGGKKDTMRDPYVKGKNMKKNISGDIFFDSGSSTSPSRLVTDLATSHTNEQNNRNPATESSFENSAVVSTGIPLDSACIKDGTSVPQPPRAAWVCCDDCQKWRCIPADLADIIGKTNCRWTCKDNQNKTFADCSIQQEKTNAEINAELDLSDASADEADNDGSNSKASKAPSWTHARINSFLHRNRRNQSVDESMVCNCKPPQDGRMGCRDGCLNRMLNIECEKRTCPCGEQCSNQQFQRRSYAKISWFHSGKKGYGLQLQEEVSEGRFLIEYVGEVLDITAYEARQSYYASKGQKHFYFMALNGGEVIDACTKGNLGRFINHSCSPNCRTEKWMVNGEVCIGIFAMRNIKKGEELTFDYNYVRVSGAAPQKCFCGTAKCRGYIGGDMSGSGIIAQDDAEAGHFEPVVTYKDAEEMLGNAYYSHGANLNIVEHETSIQREDSNNCPPATPDSELHQQTLPILSDTSEPNNSMEAWSPQDAEDVTRTPVHVSQTIESSLELLPVYGNQPLECLLKTPNTTDELTDPNVMNRSTPSSDLRSSLVPGSHAKKKNSLKHHRNVKPPCLIDNEHTLGVEGRLNSLLDRDGGISRRKDSTHEYLRLLVLTAADGDAGGTSKSIRDLALILEALLQTKSGAVLLDIINMNGLQMLHNILKQNRDHFLRRPIIRKLLKVLEFLALRGILTAEKINEGPRRAGMESFRDSMLKLTRHSDKHVHPIARKFCDKWILPYMDGPANCSTYSYSSRRKRKSRWDYQPESHYKMAGLQIAKVYSGHGQLDLQTSSIINRSHGNWVTNSNHNDVPIIGRSTDGADDDVPPGFEPQQKRQPAQASLDCGIAPGFCQGMYLPISSISYGIPIAIVQHFGTPEVEGTQCGKKWKVAPGVPFNPFPPVSTYPQGSPCRPPTSSTQISRHDGASTMGHNSSAYRGRGVDRGGRVHRNWRNGERTRYPYDHQGRRFPSNHHRLER